MFPSNDQQLHFCRSYLLSMSPTSPYYVPPHDVEDAAIKLVREVAPYILASHLFWYKELLRQLLLLPLLSFSLSDV
jgi:hypothetical protein